MITKIFLKPFEDDIKTVLQNLQYSLYEFSDYLVKKQSQDCTVIIIYDLAQFDLKFFIDNFDYEYSNLKIYESQFIEMSENND